MTFVSLLVGLISSRNHLKALSATKSWEARRKMESVKRLKRKRMLEIGLFGGAKRSLIRLVEG